MHHLSLTLAFLFGLISGGISQQIDPDFCNMNPSAWITDIAEGQDNYFVFSNLGCYRENYQVKVDMFSNINKPFVGFMIQANTPSDATKIGTWMVDRPIETIDCEFGTNNMAILKADMGMNTTYLQLKWIPPANFYQDVVFNATFIDSRGNYWKKIISMSISYNTTCDVVKNDTVRTDICDLVPTNIRKRDSASASNYGIHLSQGCYRRNDVINVTLYANILHPFSGFVLQGRREGRNMAYGMWLKNDGDGSMYKMMGCHGDNMGENTVYMNYDRNMNMSVASMKWTLYDWDTPYNMVFNATVVDSEGRHIMNITSTVLKYDIYCPESTKPPITAGASKVTVSLMMSLIGAVFMMMRALN